MTIRQLGKPKTLASILGALTSIPLALGQSVAPSPAALKPEQDIKLEKFVVTGSLIKRIAGESALPVQTITIEEIEQQGITAPSSSSAP